MSTTTAAHDLLAELTDLMEVTAEMLIETRYAAGIRNAQICAASTEAMFKPLINDSTISAADNTTTGTKPCN